LKPGDEVVASNDLYGGSYRLITTMFEPFGLKAHFVDMTDVKAVKKKINDKTRLLWVETPTNPMLSIVDIKAMAALKENRPELLLCVDNTFASPYLQNPLDLGADIVSHSATKYLGGHSDVVMGAVIVKDEALAERLYFIQNAVGAVPGPNDCFLVLRGIKTLHLRVERACDLIKDSFKEARKVLSNTRLFLLAESLGGVESLIGHPASMTHASIPRKERLRVGLTDSLIRLSVGVEDVDDLIRDLEDALR